MNVDVSQLRKLAAEFDREAARVGRDVSREVRRTAKAVEAQAEANAPVDSGELRDSIDTKIFGTGNGRRITAVVRAGTDHGRLVEEGTSRQSPQPFMRQALSAHERGYLAGVSKVIGDI